MKPRRMEKMEDVAFQYVSKPFLLNDLLIDGLIIINNVLIREECVVES